jgi:hypothetical protein
MLANGFLFPFLAKKRTRLFLSCVEINFRLTFLENLFDKFWLLLQQNKIFSYNVGVPILEITVQEKRKSFLDIRFRRMSFCYKKNWRNYFRGNPSVNH